MLRFFRLQRYNKKVESEERRVKNYYLSRQKCVLSLTHNLFAIHDIDALLHFAETLTSYIIYSFLAIGEGWGEAFYSCRVGAYA